jgi:hypothetical protein
LPHVIAYDAAFSLESISDVTVKEFFSLFPFYVDTKIKKKHKVLAHKYNSVKSHLTSTKQKGHFLIRQPFSYWTGSGSYCHSPETGEARMDLPDLGLLALHQFLEDLLLTAHHRRELNIN